MKKLLIFLNVHIIIRVLMGRKGEKREEILKGGERHVVAFCRKRDKKI